MSSHLRVSRIVVAAAIMCIPMLLTGCDWYTGLTSFLNNGETPGLASKRAKQADAPAPYYDTDEAVLTPEESSGDAAADGVVFDNQNVLAVQNGGTSPTFEIASETLVTKIETYHWNDASGNASTGEISLRGDGGEAYGPWETVGRPGQGDVPNAYWAASPNVTLPAGSYTVIDSDSSTWSQNADSGGEGFTVVHAQAAQ